MSNITVKTNNQVRELLASDEIPSKVMESEFDYVDSDDLSPRFFKYKGEYYDSHEFVVVSKNAPEEFAGWEGQHSESAFSGLLLKFPEDDYEHIIVGAYFS